LCALRPFEDDVPPLTTGCALMLRWLQARLRGQPGVRGYDIIEEIFAGRFSRLYRARRRECGREVALKVLSEAGASAAAAADANPETLWEGELLKHLQHPNIVALIECSRGRTYWLALEFIESSLGDYIGACRNAADEKRLIDLFVQLASAVAHLHTKGLVHRDICMSNVLVDPRGKLKLIDFGLTAPARVVLAGDRSGTPSYMEPAVIKGRRYTFQSDVYSLGVVMYELVTGEKPFGGKSPHERMTRSLNICPAPPSRKAGSCSAALEDVIIRCLEKERDRRFPSAVVVHRELRSLQGAASGEDNA